MLFSGLKAGVGQGCSGLYIASEGPIEPVQLEMRKFGLNTENHKKLRSVTSHHFYAPDGESHVNSAIEQISSLNNTSALSKKPVLPPPEQRYISIWR